MSRKRGFDTCCPFTNYPFLSRSISPKQDSPSRCLHFSPVAPDQNLRCTRVSDGFGSFIKDDKFGYTTAGKYRERRNRETEVSGLNSEQTLCVEGVSSALQCAVGCKDPRSASALRHWECLWVKIHLSKSQFSSQKDWEVSGSWISSCLSNLTTQNSKALALGWLQHQSYTQNNDRLFWVVIPIHLAKSSLERCL